MSDANLVLENAALKTQIANLNLRRKQAEEMTNLLMNRNLPQDILAEQVFKKLVAHMNERDIDLSSQYLGVIDTTLLALNSIALGCADQGAKQELIEVIKNLTITTHATEIK